MADLLAAARGFCPELRERAAEIESGRQLPADIAQRFAQAGFYRACVPESYGGREVDPLTLSLLIETLAQADGSAGWCVMIGATTGLLGAYMPAATARDLFADPNIILAGVYAPRGRAVEEGDHLLVNGRWQWGSGSPNAHYIAGGCVVIRDGQPVLTPSGLPISRMVLVPTKDAELANNWDVSGLCGTGSQDFAFNNLRVPKAMSVALMSDKPIARPLYAFPAFGILAAGISSVMLGLARAAITDSSLLPAAKLRRAIVKRWPPVREHKRTSLKPKRCCAPPALFSTKASTPPGTKLSAAASFRSTPSATCASRRRTRLAPAPASLTSCTTLAAAPRFTNPRPCSASSAMFMSPAST